ncbi:GLPGLI family protein [candidate division KSB1 bacterium]
MKKTFFYPYLAGLMLIFAAGDVSAQSIKGGIVKYRQTKKYNFDKIFDPKGDAQPRIKEFLAQLPKESNQTKVLYFTSEVSLYEKDNTVEEAAPNPRLQRALMGAAMRKPPEAETEKVYNDLSNKERTKQVEFMTRYFLVTGPIENQPWKLINKRVKVLRFNCMGAELKKGDNTVTAWYTPEIPVFIGPDEFSGLPGLILAVEIHGEFAFIAESVDLAPPEEEVFSKPGEGKKVTQEEFDKTVAEKVKEWKETAGKRRGMRR